jgi:molecular chaperone DnaK (HSP70)
VSDAAPRYVLGIDLGTTHTAMAMAQIAEEGGDARPRVEVFAVPQLVTATGMEARPLLPSCVYFAHESEGALALPWDPGRSFAVGEHARSRGAESPARVVTSAKSWLSYAGIDRRGPVLPLGAPEDVEKISPVEASFRYLEHLGEAWDREVARGNPDLAFGQQEIVLTVPASFDAGARELTAEAAMAAGIERLTLLEEPQAALYAWIDAHGDAWREQVRVGDLILVVDVGGGTTDLSAIAAVDRDGSLELARVAVGDHILLGGDNMDLALAHLARSRLEEQGKEVDRWQMVALTFACRAAKEALFGQPGLTSYPIAVAARGSRLLGGGLRTELTQDDVRRVLVEGYFPAVDRDARLLVRPRAGLVQAGLPYAHDPAVTRHLADFLRRQAGALSRSATAAGTQPPPSPGTMLHATAVVFNGGVMKADALRARVVDTLNAWLAAEGAPPARVLEGADLDLAVARGAVAYGLVRHGKGLRIRGGTVRSYYVGIESPAPAVPGVEPPISALCVAPFGMEEGTAVTLPSCELCVVVGEKVRFRFFGSSVRRADAAGADLQRWSKEELGELSPIEVALPAEGREAGEVVPVRLRAAVTEVGTLLLEALPTSPKFPDERWKIELSVRGEA